MDDTSAHTQLASPSRLEALRQTGLLTPEGEPALDRLTRMASMLVDAPIALVTLLARETAHIKSQAGLGSGPNAPRRTTAEESVCRHVVENNRPLVITNAREHPLVRNNPVVQNFGVAAYLGVPLRLTRGAVLGSFCVIDTQPRAWTASEQAVLADLAQAVITEMELRLALAAQQDIMAIVAHDLKTPLSGILLSCQRLLGTANAASSHPSLARIQRAAQRMEEMVMQVLDQARHEHGRVVLRTAAHPARAVLERAADGVRALAEDKRIEVAVGRAADALLVQADAARLAQVLDNLLRNAVAHAPPGSSVRCDAVEAGGRVQLSVTDQGPGIPLADQARLFDRFYRAAEAKGSGHGLGLFGASRLTEAQGGRLGVESTPGRGARFYVDLPSGGRPPPSDAKG